jgi:hypothetical protein
MKKTIFFALLVFFLCSSFVTPNNKTAKLSINNLENKVAEAWKTETSYILYDVSYELCNGDIVSFPELTVSWDMHGTRNNNITMVEGTLTFSAIGYSLTTGEVFTLNHQYRFFDKYPVINGATVITSHVKTTYTGDQGSLSQFISKLHVTVNARGEITTRNYDVSTECQ